MSRELARRNARARIALIEQLVQARKSLSLSQKDVADVIGVQAAKVSQFERLEESPTLAFIANYAQAVGAELHLAATRKDTP